MTPGHRLTLWALSCQLLINCGHTQTWTTPTLQSTGAVSWSVFRSCQQGKLITGHVYWDKSRRISQLSTQDIVLKIVLILCLWTGLSISVLFNTKLGLILSEIVLIDDRWMMIREPRIAKKIFPYLQHWRPRMNIIEYCLLF